MKRLKVKFLSFVVCLLVTFAVVLVIKGFSFFENFVQDLRGYDYDSKIAKGYDWVGPKAGEALDINYLADRSGNSLAQIPKSDLLLLTVVDRPVVPANRLKSKCDFWMKV